MLIKDFLVFIVFCPLLYAANSDLIEMGRESYGNPEVFSWGEGSKVRIGQFCSIASGVKILLGGEHRVDWVTTYPFSYFWPEAAHIIGHPKTKGDVIIGNDVWIGQNATILSGVTIGDGAVVGAMALVTKNVPPYAIVGGNPAKVIKYRFDPTVVAYLLKIQWWNWSKQEIIQALPFLLSDNMYSFLVYCQLVGKL